MAAEDYDGAGLVGVIPEDEGQEKWDSERYEIRKVAQKIRP